MIRDNDPTKTEAQFRTAIDGYRAVPAEVSTLLFPEGRLLREEVIARYQSGINLIEEVRRTKATHAAAVEAQKNAMPGLKRFHAQAMVVAQHHFGSDSKTMATFGELSRNKPKQRDRRCEGNVGEEVVTTVVEEITTVSEQGPCESKVPSCGERPTKRKCRVSRVPSRDPKPRCAEVKGCGSRVTRSSK